MRFINFVILLIELMKYSEDVCKVKLMARVNLVNAVICTHFVARVG